jgi:putative hydrolase of the HAD superfamily
VTYDGGPEPSPRAAAHIPRERLIADLPDLLASL